MQINLDTDKVLLFLQKHLQIVVPIGLYLFSYFLARHVGDSLSFLSIWHGILSLLSGLAATVTTANMLYKIYYGRFL